MAEADEIDASFLHYRPGRRRGDQRRGRPPGPLRRPPKPSRRRASRTSPRCRRPDRLADLLLGRSGRARWPPGCAAEPGRRAAPGSADDADPASIRPRPTQGERATQKRSMGSGEQVGPRTCPVPGDHNLLNAAAAFAVGWSCGLEPRGGRPPGLGLLQQKTPPLRLPGEGRRVRIYDDYAHHPTGSLPRCARQHRGRRKAGSHVGVAAAPVLPHPRNSGASFADALFAGGRRAGAGHLRGHEQPIGGRAANWSPTRLEAPDVELGRPPPRRPPRLAARVRPGGHRDDHRGRRRHRTGGEGRCLAALRGTAAGMKHAGATRTAGGTAPAPR